MIIHSQPAQVKQVSVKQFNTNISSPTGKLLYIIKDTTGGIIYQKTISTKEGETVAQAIASHPATGDIISTKVNGESVNINTFKIPTNGDTMVVITVKAKDNIKLNISVNGKLTQFHPSTYGDTMGSNAAVKIPSGLLTTRKVDSVSINNANYKFHMDGDTIVIEGNVPTNPASEYVVNVNLINKTTTNPSTSDKPVVKPSTPNTGNTNNKPVVKPSTGDKNNTSNKPVVKPSTPNTGDKGTSNTTPVTPKTATGTVQAAPEGNVNISVGMYDTQTNTWLQSPTVRATGIANGIISPGIMGVKLPEGYHYVGMRIATVNKSGNIEQGGMEWGPDQTNPAHVPVQFNNCSEVIIYQVAKNAPGQTFPQGYHYVTTTSIYTNNDSTDMSYYKSAFKSGQSLSSVNTKQNLDINIPDGDYISKVEVYSGSKLIKTLGANFKYSDLPSTMGNDNLDYRFIISKIPTNKPVVKPITPDSKPVVKPTKPVVNPTKPSTGDKGTTPVVKPITPDSKPVVKPSKPVVKPNTDNKGDKGTTPVVKPTKPSTGDKGTTPVVKPTKPSTDNKGTSPSVKKIVSGPIKVTVVAENSGKLLNSFVGGAVQKDGTLIWGNMGWPSGYTLDKVIINYGNGNVVHLTSKEYVTYKFPEKVYKPFTMEFLMKKDTTTKPVVKPTTPSKPVVKPTTPSKPVVKPNTGDKGTTPVVKPNTGDKGTTPVVKPTTPSKPVVKPNTSDKGTTSNTNSSTGSTTTKPVTKSGTKTINNVNSVTVNHNTVTTTPVSHSVATKNIVSTSTTAPVDSTMNNSNIVYTGNAIEPASATDTISVMTNTPIVSNSPIAVSNPIQLPDTGLSSHNNAERNTGIALFGLLSSLSIFGLFKRRR